MKQPWEWDEDDIIRMVNDKEPESAFLDYKRCDALDKTEGKKIELSKDASAFANAGGGTLIYGVIEDKTAIPIPVAIDIGYDPTDITGEWIDQVLSSKIQPSLSCRIKQIPLTKTRPGRVIYIIHVPQGRKCHMAGDFRYWKRNNFTSERMHDYEVRDVNRREEAPDLQIYMELIDYQLAQQSIQLAIGIRNLSPAPALYLLGRIYFEKSIVIDEYGGMQRIDHTQFIKLHINGQEVETKACHRSLHVPNNLPIWNGLMFNFTDRTMHITVRYGGRHLIIWELHSPSMLPRRGVYSLVVSDTQISIEEEVRELGSFA